MYAQRKTILIVDYEPAIQQLLSETFTREGYVCQTATTTTEAKASFITCVPDLVLLDINMPGGSGEKLLVEIKSAYPGTAVIMATAVCDLDIAIRCLTSGADDYIIKPFRLKEVIFSASRAIERQSLIAENHEYQHHMEELVAIKTVGLNRAMVKLKEASLDTIRRLATAAEYRNEDTGNHLSRMSQYCAAIARKLGLDDKEQENILYASPMHDIGKIGIRDSILLKPGELTGEEWKTMKRHTIIGSQILTGSEIDFIRLGETIALTHHEKWDGSGYPAGLKHEEIPIAGRIVAIADAFDAMRSRRPYKEPFPLEKTLGIIRANRGSHFDPEVVDAFFAIDDLVLT